MIAIALQSGSQGNCIYVETQGVRLLFDAGISGKRAAERLAARGIDITAVDAVIISHDHADHAKCAGVFQRKFGLPLYITEPTLHEAQRRNSLGRLGAVHHFRAGQTLSFGPVAVESVSTEHDAADGVVFVVESAGKRLGILTDLGNPFAGLGPVIATLDAVFLESNYDPDMLANGPYPVFLQRRISGPNGHISNFESAELLHDHADARLQWVCLAHLSENNNAPQVALGAHRELNGARFPLHTARYRDATGPFRVE